MIEGIRLPFEMDKKIIFPCVYLVIYSYCHLKCSSSYNVCSILFIILCTI